MSRSPSRKAKNQTQGLMPASLMRDVHYTIDALANPLQREVMEHFARTGLITDSLAASGMSYQLHCHYLDVDKSYRETFEFVQSIIPQRLQDTLLDMALNGVEKPIIHMGEQTGSFREKSWKATEAALQMAGGVQQTSPMTLRPTADLQRPEVQVTHIDEIKVLILSEIEQERKRRGLDALDVIDVEPDAILSLGVSPDSDCPDGENGTGPAPDNRGAGPDQEDG